MDRPHRLKVDLLSAKTNSIWKDFREIAVASKKDVLLISEIFGDTSQWLQGDRFDGTMNYSFRESDRKKAWKNKTAG